MDIFKKKKKKYQHKAKTISVQELEEIYPATGLKLIRPDLHLIRVTLICVGVLAGLGLFCAVLLHLLSQFSFYKELPFSYVGKFVLCYILSLIICLCICAKYIVIFAIRVYQKYAPYTVRSLCVLIPNCSEYMILAIRKYGLIKGIKKGYARLNRCGDDNLNIKDYP